MTLEEAIKHCEEVAEENTKACDRSICFQNEYNNIECDKCYIEVCNKCASEHRQLAEWLRELKAYRKAEKEIEQELVNWNDIDNGKCRGLFLATSIIQNYKGGEVNADEDSN